MLRNSYPVQWNGDQAIVALPEHIGISNAGQVRDELLSVINLGALTLIADMTATVSCDHAGADAVVRAWQRAAASGTELRLVVTVMSVSRVLDLRGLDRQVSVYPSLEAAAAARLPAPAADRPRGAGRFTRAVIRGVTGNGRPDDLAALARDAAAAQRDHLRLLDTVVTGLFHAGLSLQASADLPADAARLRTDAVLIDLDDIIGQVRAAALAESVRFALPRPRGPGDAG